MDGKLELLKDCHNKCHCTLYYGKHCVEQFTVRPKRCPNLLLLGIISSSLNDADMTLGKKSKPKVRKLTRMRNFSYGNKRICRYTFLLLLEIGPQKFTNLKNWYRGNITEVVFPGKEIMDALGLSMGKDYTDIKLAFKCISNMRVHVLYD